MERMKADADAVRAAARTEAEKAEAERKKFLSEQAERDAARAAADELKSRQLLEEVRWSSS